MLIECFSSCCLLSVTISFQPVHCEKIIDAVRKGLSFKSDLFADVRADSANKGQVIQLCEHYIFSDQSIQLIMSILDYNLVRREEKVYSRLEKLQYGLLITNIILMLIALANFSVCIWIRYLSSMWIK